MAENIQKVILTADDQTRAAFESFRANIRSAKDSAESLNNTSSVLRSGLAALAGAASINMFASMIQSVVNTGDHLNDLSKITGMSVTELGGLEKAAELNGTTLEMVATGSKNLAKNMFDDSAAFKMLQIDTRNADGQFRNIKDVMLDVAARFSGMADGAAKSALANKIFGKSGQELIPMLNEGRDALQDNIDKYAQYSGMSQETAQASDEFNDTLTLLHGRIIAIKTIFVSELLPTLNQVGKSLLDNTQSTNQFASVAQIASNVLKGLAIVGYTVIDTFRGIGREIGARAAQLAALAGLDFKGAAFIGDELAKDNIKSREEYDKFVDTILNGKAAIEQAMEDKGKDKNRTEFAMPTIADNSADLKKAKTAYDNLIQSIQKKIEVGKLELDLGRALTDVEKINLDIDTRVTTGELKLTEANRQQIATELQELTVIQALIENRKIIQEQSTSLVKAGFDRVTSIKNEVESLQQQNAMIGMTTEQIKSTTIAKTLEESQVIRNAAAYAGPLHDAYIKYADDLVKVAGYQDELIEQKQIAQYAENFSNAFSSIEQTGRQAFTQFAAHGKSAMKSIGESIKLSIIDMIYQFTARKWIINIGASISGMIGSGVANASENGGTNLLSVANLGSSALNLIKGGFGVTDLLGTGLTKLGGAIGSPGLSAFGGGFAGDAIGGLAAGGFSGGAASMASMGSSIGAAAGPLIAVAVVDQIARIIAGNKTLGGTAGAVLNYIPAIGPLINGLFGRGPLKQKESQLTGDVSTLGLDSGFLKINYKAKGGAFASDKHDYAGVDLITGLASTDNNKALGGVADGLTAYAKQLAQQINQTVGSVGSTLRGLSADLDLSIKPLDDFHHRINLISESGKALTDAQISDEIAAISDEMVKSLMPSIDQFSKSGETSIQTISRLGAEFNVLSSAAELILGKSSADASAMIKGKSLEGRTAFVDAAGGVDALNQDVKFFADNFLTAAERLAPAQESLNEQLNKLGLSANLTKDQFRGLVQSFGQVGGVTEDTFISLLKISPLFVEVSDGMDALGLSLNGLSLTSSEMERSVRSLTEVGYSFADAVNIIKTTAPEAIKDFIQAHGGLDNIASLTSKFANNFMTDAQRLKAPNDYLSKQLSDLGFSANMTAAEYARAVMAQGEFSKASVESRAALLGLVDVFTEVRGGIKDAIDNSERLISSKRSALVDAYNKEKTALEGVVSRFKDLADNLRSASDSLALGNLSPLTPQQKYEESKSQFNRDRAGAAAGDETALQRLPESGKAFLEASKTYNASSIEYVTDFNYVRQALESAAVSADTQVSDAQKQLSELTLSVGKLTDIDDHVVDVATAIKELSAAILQGSGTLAISDQQNGVSGLQTAGAQGGDQSVVNHAASGLSVSDQQIRDFANAEGRTPMEIYRAAVANGVSSERLSSVTNIPIDSINKFVKDNNLAAFERGTDLVPRTGLAMLHKGEAVTPASTVTDIKTIRQEIIKQRIGMDKQLPSDHLLDVAKTAYALNDTKRISSINTQNLREITRQFDKNGPLEQFNIISSDSDNIRKTKNIDVPIPDFIRRRENPVQHKNETVVTSPKLIDEVAALRQELAELRREQNKQTSALINVAVASQKMNADMIIKSNQDAQKSAAWREQAMAVVR